MAISDILSGVGNVLETGAKAVGSVAAPIAQRTAQVVSGEAPQIDAENRQHQEALEDAAINAKAAQLESQLQVGQKYGTLTPAQQQEYVDQISQLYSHPRHAGTLMEKLRQAIHPNGAYAQAPKSSPLPIATPEGGTLAADERNAAQLTESRKTARAVSPESQYFDAYAKGLGLSDSTQMTSDQWDAAIAARGKAARAPRQDHWTQRSFDGNLYKFNSATGEMMFIGSESNVTVHRGVQNVTQADGSIVQIPVTTYTSKKSGKPITDEDGSPMQTIDLGDQQASPSSGETKPANAQSGTPAPKPKRIGGVLPKVNPVAPSSVGGITDAKVVGSHGSPLLKSDTAQYTKAAEDANGAQEALQSAMQLYGPNAQGTPTASSDQALIYSWVRSNVAGAGRMTAAEFRQAASTGSLPLRAQTWYDKATTGRLPAELTQMLFADVQRGAKAKQDEAESLRKRVQDDMGSSPRLGIVLPRNGASAPPSSSGIKIQRDANGRITGIE